MNGYLLGLSLQSNQFESGIDCMKEIFNKIWNDEVGSSVIAGLICMILGTIICKVFNIKIHIDS